MTIAADCQLALPIEETASSAAGWEGLPEQARAAVLVLLARLIARGVLVADESSVEAGGAEASRG
jgi:hypothetical protein